MIQISKNVRQPVIFRLFKIDGFILHLKIALLYQEIIGDSRIYSLF
jgi:hypothetical protein